MNIQFVVNDYLLAWNLLFRPSISEDIQTLKERLWKNYSKEYMKLEKENVEILKYTNDFIPDDDTIYNFVFDSEEYKLVKKQTDKYRRFLMKIWDSNQKVIQSSLKELLRFKVENTYQILVIHPYFDNVEYLKKNPKKNIVWGKKEDTEDGLKAIMRILFTAVKYELNDYQEQNKEIVTAITDLLVTNEIYTRVSGYSKYEEGIKRLKLLKRQLYPYWLMYQGADREELVSFMMRDRMPFDIDKYPIEKGLRKVDFKGFIDFCCTNQKYIIRLNELDKI
ncbi:MAG: hypothetical protein IJ568_01620 [Bacilli bacterium]|nr:hypothetical protein [Bacilli bacterium]